MRLQPLRDGRCRAIGEQIHHLVAFEITHDGPEASASPPGPFIEPNNPRGRTGWEGHAMDKAQDRPDAPRQAQHVRKQRPSTAANGDAHVA
jgi:hypothetical protein